MIDTNIFSSQQSVPRLHLGQRQASHVEAVEVRTQHPGRGREGEHQPAQLRHHGQLLRGQAGVHGGPGQESHCQWCPGAHMAGTGSRYISSSWSNIFCSIFAQNYWVMGKILMYVVQYIIHNWL